ncbi:MAG: dTMP kinase [Methanomicrobia archaeon]|jgi:dTMP kinase|nr:dTMP kinase [Bacilli bacterium]NCA95838.1 dTMP kinase [Methanomicrobia archaeon]
MFITFEGPEGSGKTSAANEIVRLLVSKGYDVLYTREPGGTPIAEEIRGIILDKKNTALDPRAEALLYAASRRQHLIEKVWPALKEGKVVICDRYLDSSLAYQGGARNIGIDNVLNINLFATEGTYPDLTLLFDITPEKGLERIAVNKKREVNRLDLEALEFHRTVRETFLELAKKYRDRYIIIDASKTLPEVVGVALNAIVDRLEQKHVSL